VIWIWLAVIIVQVCMLWSLPSRFWMALWITASLTVNVGCFIVRSNGPVYSAVWMLTAPVAAFLLLAVAAEAAPFTVRSVSIALVLAGVVHSALVLPNRWPESPLQFIESGIAAVQIFAALVMVQDKYKDNVTRALIGYCAAMAICYYAAPAFPRTIGTAIEAIDLVGMLAIGVSQDALNDRNGFHHSSRG